MAEQLSYTTTDSTKQGAIASIHSWYQSFVPTTTFTLTGLEINIDSIVTLVAKATIFFYNADEDGKPVGAPLSGVYLGDFSTDSTGWQGDLTLSEVTLTSGSRYCFRLQGRGGTTGEYYFDFDSSDGYANGTCWYWDGSDYVAQNGDINFKIYGTNLVPGVPTLVSPTPTGVTDITLDETPLEWAAGDPAGDTYEIYFRESGDAWTLVGAAQAGVEWAVEFGTLDYGTTYQWRVDATNEYDTTEGDTWSFTTISFDRILISYDLIDGGPGPYDTPPGVEGTDWSWTGENAMLAVRRLVVAINNKIWYEIV